MDNNLTYHIKGRDTMKTIDVIFVSDELVGSLIVSRKEYERVMRQKVKTEAEKLASQKSNECNDGVEESKNLKRKSCQMNSFGEVNPKRSKYIDDVELALAALENDDVEKVEIIHPSTLFDKGDVSAKKICNFGNAVRPVKNQNFIGEDDNLKNSESHKVEKQKKQTVSQQNSDPAFGTSKKKVLTDIKEIQKILENSDEDFSGSDSDSSYKVSDDSLSDSKNGIDGENKKDDLKLSKSFFETYCDLQSSKKSKCSVGTLKKLKNSKLTQEKLEEIVKNFGVSESHKSCIERLFNEILSLFSKWDFILSQNFNLLLYGAGSKKEVVSKFVERFIDDSPVIVVNGFFPDVTGKEIIEKICSVLKIKVDKVDVIQKIESKIKNYHVKIYLAINNIDGIMLRNKKVQNMLSQLGKIEQIHIIASIDHINAPLIWDKRTSSEFNWVWFDTTTFLSYAEETLYEGNLLLQNSGKATLTSLRNVFNALTKNSQEIFLIMIRNQVESGNKKVGISFRELYEECRKELLISSDVALRTQLKEFIDHMILKQKKNADGEELFIVMLENNILKQFLDEKEANQT